MKPICFIGARGGSKGVIRKNIRILGKKPLIAHTIEKCLNSKIFSSIIVSTEDNEIAKIAEKYGAEVPFLRPKKLATDKASMNDVLLHGINQLDKLGFNFDIMVIRDCTVPFIRNKDIKGSINHLKKNKADIVLGVYRQHLNPYFNMMEKNTDGFLRISKKIKNPIARRQDAPIVYQLNGLFTMYIDRFQKYKKTLMPKSLPYEIPQETGLMIDTELEFQLAQYIVKHKLIS